MHRRRFLRSSVGAGCVVVAFSACDREKADELADSGVANVDHADLAGAKAPCRYCGTGCGVEVGMHDGKETRYRYAAGHDPFVKKEKGVHFYKAKGYGEKAAVWIRPYHPPAEGPDDDYPLWLCTGRVLEHWHTGSMTRRVRELHQAVPEAYVEMNAQDAVALGMQDGQRARVVSRRGSVELLVRVEGRGRCPRGTVFVPFFDEKRLANILTLDAMDNISKEPDYKKCAVRLERV